VPPIATRTRARTATAADPGFGSSCLSLSSLAGPSEPLQPLCSFRIAQSNRLAVPFCRGRCVTWYAPRTDLRQKRWIVGFPELGRRLRGAAVSGLAVEQSGGRNVTDGKHCIPAAKQLGDDFGREGGGYLSCFMVCWRTLGTEGWWHRTGRDSRRRRGGSLRRRRNGQNPRHWRGRSRCFDV
jgi:hypothetical protein